MEDIVGTIFLKMLLLVSVPGFAMFVIVAPIMIIRELIRERRNRR